MHEMNEMLQVAENELEQEHLRLEDKAAYSHALQVVCVCVYVCESCLHTSSARRMQRKKN
jgi:hypothetical protein